LHAVCVYDKYQAIFQAIAATMILYRKGNGHALSHLSFLGIIDMTLSQLQSN
jgi:hypothetical protein